MKRIISLLLALVLVIGMLPLTTLAASLAITQEPKSVKVLEGQNAKVTLKATGDGLTYKWYYKNPGATKYSYTSAFTGPDYSIKMNKDRDGRYVYCKVYDKYGTVVKSKTVSLRMTDGVTIKSQSKSFEEVDTNYCDLYVSFNGGTAPYSVTWQKTNAAGTYETLKSYTVSEADVDGDYSSWHTVKILKADEGRKFQAVIKDAKGNSVNSSDITVKKVHPTLSITQQPTDQYVAIGDTATFTVKAEGADLSYRWYYRDPGATANTRVAGLNADTYSFTMTEDTVGRQVFVKVIENWDLEAKYFELEETSNKVYAYSNEMKITKQPQDWFGYEYDFADFSVEVAGGKAPYTYKWEYSVNGGAYITDKTSTSDTLVLEEVEESVLEEGRKYRCVITDANGKSVTSDTALLGEVLHFDVPIDEVPYSAKVGETVEFWADADGGVKPYTYTWQYTALGGNVFMDLTDSFGRVSGLGTDTLELTVAEVDGTQNFTYRCVVTDARGETITTPTVSVELEYDPLTIKTQPFNQKNVAVGSTTAFGVNITGGVKPYSYQWQSRPTNSATYTDLKNEDFQNTATNGALLVKASTATEANSKRFRCVITDAMGNKVYTQDVYYTIPLYVAYLSSTSQYTVGDKVELFAQVEGGLKAYTYQWQYINDNHTEYVNIGSKHTWASGYNSATLKFTLSQSDIDLNYKYRCVITDALGTTIITSARSFG